MKDSQANPFNRETIIGEVLEGWQSMLNLAAELLNVPAALITRVDGKEIEVFLASKSKGNPYKQGLKTHFPDSGFYCEWVVKNRKSMIIPNARKDPLWKNNAAIALNMISYMGMPIIRPDGNVFGTICFLSSKESIPGETIMKLAEQFKRMIELSLSIIFVNEEISQRDRILADLSKIFPICVYCKKVSNKKNEWIPVEKYIKNISGHRASHGICPECYGRERLKH